VARENTLTPEDGDKVREAFEVRLAGLLTIPDQDRSSVEPGRPAANDAPYFAAVQLH
jgi:hypothetical protein